MKTLFSCLFLIILSEATAQNYWQQEVNYKIQVKLDDRRHFLSAQESFEYINHSPDRLEFIYIHLWPNAYSDFSTALGQQTSDSEYEFFDGDKEKNSGFIDSLDFKVNGQSAKWEFDPKNKDICKLMLPQALEAGGRMTVSTPFRVKIPSGSISRLGHIGQSYQITQWYPKPAVYDKNGWNQMPYLNQGEFYSEYGSFDVQITLPKNYVVGATGDLQTESEIAFLNQKANETKAKYDKGELPLAKKKFGNDTLYPQSSTEWKTLRYIQSKVHDFAWFTDKRYEVLKGEVELPHSKRKVTSWAMFTPRNAGVWKKSIEYINDGTYYYSKWNGDYPYNQVTAVDGTISAGGGMEYPNVTVIGNTSSPMQLEIVIVHEVGHNWFYGILGSNERVHGWMDEGMNTLNEMRYMTSKYPDNKELSELFLGGRFHFNDLNHHDSGDFGYRLLASIGEDQPIETHSADFTSVNYGSVMYQKTGLVFHYLKSILGDENFDKGMQAYFEAWKFKHPQPADMRQVLEKTSGKNLAWLFEDLIQTTAHLDFRVLRVKNKEQGAVITIMNNGQFDAPVKITVYSGDQREDLVSEPFGQTIKMQSKFKEVTRVVIDEDKQIPEMYRGNNTWDKKRLFNRVEPWKFEFLIGDHERERHNLFWTPTIGWNENDGLMAGASIHNMGVVPKRLQYVMIPMYSFENKRLVGIGEWSLNFLPKNNIKLFRMGLSLKSFGQQGRNNMKVFGAYGDYFAALSPYLYFKLGDRGPDKKWQHQLLIQGMLRQEHTGWMYNYTFNQPFWDPTFLDTKVDVYGAFVRYDFQYFNKRFQYQVSPRLDWIMSESEQMIVRSQLTQEFRFKYLNARKERWIDLRVYAGAVLKNDFNATTFNNRYNLAMAGASGVQDVFVEDYNFNRQYSASFSTQRMENMGGFRSTTEAGSTSHWLVSGNFYMQSPWLSKNFGVFADVGGFSDGKVVRGMLNTGIGFKIAKVFGLYFPVYWDQHTEDAYISKAYIERIRFTLKMNPVNQRIRLQGLF